MIVLQLAMPTPLRRYFDYLPPKDATEQQLAQLQAGQRVLAPFGSRTLVGVLVATKNTSDIAPKKLKHAHSLLSLETAIPTHIMDLCLWATQYYQHPVGDVISHALPVLLRKNKPLPNQLQTYWQLSTKGKGLPLGALEKRAPKQAKLLALLQEHTQIAAQELSRYELANSHAKALADKELISRIEKPVDPWEKNNEEDNNATSVEPPLPLNSEQKAAFDAIDLSKGYHCSLLEGVTGSGKTEVYLQLIERCLHYKKQALVLIPEIGLTPQTLARFKRRFASPIAVLHSQLTDRERLHVWQGAKQARVGIIIGTRSAVFTPLPNLGLIIIDEEHDSSFKQQESFRYSARDIAIKRAYDQNCPIVLGSATPSLESLHNALKNRYQHLCLTQRATGALSPPIQLIDIRNAALNEGISQSIIEAIQHTLASGNQALVFINRRGFAPVYLCHSCGFVAHCHQCDARLTVHFQEQVLRCHHCEASWSLPKNCPECNGSAFEFKGSGTERTEQALTALFTNTPIIRIDRDTTSGKYAMQSLVDEVHRGEPCILVGTQMLAKGHHFPNVTLVAILDADYGLFSADFRGPERMGQLLIQVAGRAGRENKPGRVLLQTHQPDHPLLKELISKDYRHFADRLLTERQQSQLPPFGYLALVRAQAKSLDGIERFLQHLRTSSETHQSAVRYLGPLPAPMARKAGLFRAQLLIQSAERRALNQALTALCQLADQHPDSKRLQWSIDVDPLDMF